MSSFSYKDAKSKLIQVPVRYGDTNRQVANIQRKNSENTMPSAPMISCYIKNLSIARSRLQDPTHVSKVHIKERDTWVNPETGQEEYINTMGENYTVERLMPVPYDLTFQADIWTTNTDQKLQILEQLLVLFRPSLELQTTDNYLDWTSLSTLELTDMTWTNRQIPAGTEQDIDIATMQFLAPAWLTTPAKVKQMGIVTSIITSIFVEAPGTIEGGDFKNIDSVNYFEGRSPSSILATTIGNYSLLVVNNTAKLVAPGVHVSNSTGEAPVKYGSDVNWYRILDLYPGKFIAGLTQIRLMKPSGEEISARISLDPLNESIMHLDIDADTIPANTEVPQGSGKTYIDAIIDPTTFVPSNPTSGIRYLILEDINTDPNLAVALGQGTAATAWKNSDNTYLVANANDIITWDGTTWSVIFSSKSVSTLTYITNLRTGIQYLWDGEIWSKSFEGEYAPENWRIII
jgi:hypothetical protein